MDKMLTDMHTHSTYSHDGKSRLTDMLSAALEKGVCFYGISEHFDYDYDLSLMTEEQRLRTRNADPAEYFHAARHLQEDYAGCMNVCVGAEFGYSDRKEVQAQYAATYEKFRPDYVINSVHGTAGQDFARYTFTQSRRETYGEYLRLVRRSLDAPYPYDIVGHLEYVVRYAPFEERAIRLDEFRPLFDDIFKTIIERGKILELNTSTKTLPRTTLPSAELLHRYYELGGRNVSYGSDAHDTGRILDKRSAVIRLAREIGFEQLTVPMRGEYIKVEI